MDFFIFRKQAIVFKKKLIGMDNNVVKNDSIIIQLKFFMFVAFYHNERLRMGVNQLIFSNDII